MSESCCGCGKTIDVLALEVQQRRVLTIVMAIMATFLMMVGAARYSRSSSLLSGGLDNFGDALTYALSLAVVGASGLAKARVALFKGLLILGAAMDRCSMKRLLDKLLNKHDNAHKGTEPAMPSDKSSSPPLPETP